MHSGLRPLFVNHIGSTAMLPMHGTHAVAKRFALTELPVSYWRWKPMLHFNVDDTQTAVIDNCVKCCCESMSLKPGTINKVSVGYAPWAVPIGRLHCAPQFVLEQMQTCPAPAGNNLPPQPAAKVAFETLSGNTISGDLNVQVTDPETDPLTYKLLPMYGPVHGKLTFYQNGMFEYTPDPTYAGADRFYASVSDGINAPVVFEVVIGVRVSMVDIPGTPHVSIDVQGVQVNERYYTISFPVKVSPAAQLCEVWKLTVLQGALDCDCVCYTRTDCFDIRIVKC
jgi:Bacterial Ig domain